MNRIDNQKKNKQNPIYFIISFDTDNDPIPVNRFQLSWNGIEKGIPLINKRIEKIQETIDQKIKLTWFVRCDNQLEKIYGNSGFLLKRYERLWNDLINRGDEIAWHPHIYKKVNGFWKLETKKEPLLKKISKSFEHFIEFSTPSSVRLGESYQSNASMKLFNDLGLQVDSTALPGRMRNDQDRFFDWIDTPRHPYHPSKTDYRISGSDSLNILEVPMSIIPIKTEYDSVPLDRYINLSFYNSLMKDNMENIIRKNDFIVTITHPFEIIPTNSSKHGLLSFDIGEFQKNFINLLEICERIQRPYKFITMSEVPKIWNEY